MSSYEKLPQSKLKNGYTYKLVKRTDKVAMYSMTNEKFPEDTSTGYEVFLIAVGKAYSLVQKNGKAKGKVYNYPAAEKFPGNEDFGKTAWTYTTQEAADKKFNELEKV